MNIIRKYLSYMKANKSIYDIYSMHFVMHGLYGDVLMLGCQRPSKLFIFKSNWSI